LTLSLPAPGTAAHWFTGPGWRHPAEVVPMLARLAPADARDPDVARWARRAVAGIPRGRYVQRARALLGAIRRDVRFVRDPPGAELVRHPRDTLAEKRGDCDCQSRLLGAAMHAIGEFPRYVVVSTLDPAEPDHIFPEMWSPAGWITIDSAANRPRLGIGAGVAGPRRIWDAAGREVPSMQTGTRTAIVLRRPGMGAGNLYVPGRLDGLGQMPGASEAVAAAMPFIKKALEAAKNWLVGTTYDAYTNFVNRVAEADAGVQPGASNPETIAKCLAVGVIPVYCSDSQGTRDNIFREFTSRGWTGIERWSNAYSAGFGRKTWWYGLIARTKDAPPQIVASATQRAAADLQSAWNRTIDFCINAKGRMRHYGGNENYEEMIVDAIPVLPTTGAAATTQTTTGTTPPAPGAQLVRPAALPPTPSAVLVRSVTPPPPAAPPAPVVAPAAVAPAAPTPAAAAAGMPAGARLVDPAVGAFAAMFEQQAAAELVRRAGAAARAFRGLGAATSVRIIDPESEARIAAALPSAAALVASRSIALRSAQVNYALAHIGEANMDRVQAAERLLAWKKALGVASPAGSIVDDGIRALLAAQGGFPVGAVPTLDQIAARLPAGSTTAAGAVPPVPGAVLVTPAAPAAPAPTATGLPAAPATSGRGAPELVSPAPAGAVADTGDRSTLAILAVLAYLALRKRRRT
jgi:hypothetical protein